MCAICYKYIDYDCQFGNETFYIVQVSNPLLDITSIVRYTLLVEPAMLWEDTVSKMPSAVKWQQFMRLLEFSKQ